jgi:GNAT superfamily N-acetyltransferase
MSNVPLPPSPIIAFPVSLILEPLPLTVASPVEPGFSDEDRSYFGEHVFQKCEVWGALDNTRLIGIIAFREGWIDHLYVLPNAQGHGVGTALLDVAKSAFSPLHLWTFQRNAQARRFYETRGFVLIKETDGTTNEEKEPDALYRWARH